jgi:hypothetical protein
MGIDTHMCYIRFENLHRNKDAQNHHSHIIEEYTGCIKTQRQNFRIGLLI